VRKGEREREREGRGQGGRQEKEGASTDIARRETELGAGECRRRILGAPAGGFSSRVCSVSPWT